MLDQKTRKLLYFDMTITSLPEDGDFDAFTFSETLEVLLK